MQHALSRNDVVEVDYVGTQAVHLSQLYNLNIPVFGPGATTTNEQARRPQPALGNVTQIASDGNSIYQGLEFAFRHRYHAGFTMSSNFSFSKSIDDGSAPANGLIGGVQPTLNHNFRRALSDFDQPFTWRSTAAWSTPALKGRSGVVRGILGSWDLNGIFSVESGMPFSVTASADNSLTGLSADFADLVPGVPLYISGQSQGAYLAQAFNTSAFKPNAVGTFGNTGRNILRGPGLVDLDLGLAKNIPLTERWRLSFRSEFFNSLNHANFKNPGNGIGTPSFGQITAARDPRILQLSLRLAF